MASLTYSEQILIVSILAAIIAGLGIKHWRDARREMPTLMASPLSAPPARASADSR